MIGAVILKPALRGAMDYLTQRGMGMREVQQNAAGSQRVGSTKPWLLRTESQTWRRYLPCSKATGSTSTSGPAVTAGAMHISSGPGTP
jgi:hypothetical protein